VLPARRPAAGTDLEPREPNVWETLAVSHYRTGDCQSTITALQRVRELLSNEEECDNPFFEAMALWQLGRMEEARRRYDQGVGWMEKNAPGPS
jgi:Flp pilus assembly protein TadD